MQSTDKDNNALKYFSSSCWTRSH